MLPLIQNVPSCLDFASVIDETYLFEIIVRLLLLRIIIFYLRSICISFSVKYLQPYSVFFFWYNFLGVVSYWCLDHYILRRITFLLWQYCKSFSSFVFVFSPWVVFSHVGIIFVVRLINLYFYDIWIVCFTQKWVLSENIKKVICPLLILLVSFIMFKNLSQLVFHGYRWEVDSFFLKYLFSYLQHHYWKMSHWFEMSSLLFTKILHICASISQFSILFHWSVCLIRSITLFILDTTLRQGIDFTVNCVL